MSNIDTKKKRYAFCPLEVSKKDIALDGEILIDKATGDIFVKDEFGNLNSKTLELESKVDNIIDNSLLEQIDENYNTIRKSYRFYFDGTKTLRLDRNLRLPEGAYYFKIKDVNDESIMYTPKPCRVKEDAEYVGALKNNVEYWVIFYNINGDPITQHLFVGKYSEGVISDLVPPDKMLSRIEIELGRENSKSGNVFYLGDSWNDICPIVYAYYADMSRRNVTNENGLMLYKPDISTVGRKTIEAVYLNLDDNQHKYASREIEIIDEPLNPIQSLKVEPKVIISISGKKNIRLVVTATYENGKEQDITNRCVFDNFDDQLFNEMQTIIISTNYGQDHVFEQEYTINVFMNEEPYIVQFNNELMRIENRLSSVPFTYYRVRNAGDLDLYHTLSFSEIGSVTDYVGSLKTGQPVIIEYYNEEKELKSSVYATTEFRLELPEHRMIDVDADKILANVSEPTPSNKNR